MHSGRKGKKKDTHLNWLGGCEVSSGVMVSLGESKLRRRMLHFINQAFPSVKRKEVDK